MASALHDLTCEKRKVNLSHNQIMKILKDAELLQTVLQDSKKLKEAVLNFCNKVGLLTWWFSFIMISCNSQNSWETKKSFLTNWEKVTVSKLVLRFVSCLSMNITHFLKKNSVYYYWNWGSRLWGGDGGRRGGQTEGVPGAGRQLSKAPAQANGKIAQINLCQDVAGIYSRCFCLMDVKRSLRLNLFY